MKNAFNPESRAGRLPSDVRGLVIVASLIGGLILWFTITGRTDRAIYRGFDPAWAETGVVRLKTDPAGNYVIERNAEFDAMKIGCVYDLNYDNVFGRHNQSSTRIKTVRQATLVGC
ncbi:hypothetical protein [Bradyrhizobium sp. WSM471]|uniref:hypothetical protein n=1 Tax=Bradyrhizobium sp. WSM471 TaxID=319017 RepID=UPI00024D25A7|nr:MULTISPECIES: hypothetical protein [Bradyrhizobium]EHR03860.1 hypothetical protein Bra471DRAFT_04652 [Bradyrhizobium sp. WSM471]UFW39038.1 hypothetical protein BcanWSM471_22785 [Bradyrhizobium canariense]